MFAGLSTRFAEKCLEHRESKEIKRLKRELAVAQQDAERVLQQTELSYEAQIQNLRIELEQTRRELRETADRLTVAESKLEIRQHEIDTMNLAFVAMQERWVHFSATKKQEYQNPSGHPDTLI